MAISQCATPGDIRRKRGLTQRQLAARVRCARETIARIEGRRQGYFTEGLQARITHHLQLTADEVGPYFGLPDGSVARNHSTNREGGASGLRVIHGQRSRPQGTRS